MRTIEWRARLLPNPEIGVKGIEVYLALLEAKSGKFISVDASKADAEGLLKGLVKTTSAPAMRLTLDEDGQMVLHAIPRFALEGTTLKVDFGAIMLLPKGDRFVADPTMFDNPGEPLTIVGLPTSDGRLPAALGGYALETISLLQQQLRLKDENLRRAESQAADARGGMSDLQHQLDEFVQMLERERTLCASQIAGLRSQLENFRKQADEKVTISAFAESLGTGINNAQSKLKETGFQIGRVAVTARAFVDTQGGSLQFPNRADSADVAAAPVTDISIAFQPTTAPEADYNKVPVPDVNQLTESAARRVLASVGLQLEATYGPPNLRPGSVEGQAMLQTPAAGAHAERGEIVLVVFARSAA